MEIRVSLTDKQQEEVAANLPISKLLEIAMTKCFTNNAIETGHAIRILLEEVK